jgi:hypothetical protein
MTPLGKIFGRASPRSDDQLPKVPAASMPGPLPSMADWSPAQKKAFADHISRLGAKCWPDKVLPPIEDDQG